MYLKFIESQRNQMHATLPRTKIFNLRQHMKIFLDTDLDSRTSSPFKKEFYVIT